MLKKDSYRGVVCVWMGTPSGMLCVLGWGSWMLKEGLLSGLGVCVDGDSQWNVVCMGMGKLNAQKELLSVEVPAPFAMPWVLLSATDLDYCVRTCVHIWPICVVACIARAND